MFRNIALRFFFIGFCFWGICTPARADLSLSPWIGPAVTWLKGSSPPPAGSGAGFRVGFGAQLVQTFTPYFRVSLEPRYVPYGVTAGLIFGLTGDVSVDYFETALLLSASVISSPSRARGSWEFQLLGGPFVGAALSRRIELLSLVKVDLGNRFKGGNWGIDMGFLTDYWFRTALSFRFSVRFLMGLEDISLDPAESYYTRQILFTLGANWVF